MKIAVILLLFYGVLFADVLKVKDKFPYDSFSDQFENKLLITPQTKKIIISFSKKNGKAVKAFLQTHKGYLEKKQAVYLADVSSVPSLAMLLFMKPALQKNNFSVGLIEDEEIANILPKVEGKTTVIRLEKMYIKSIKFIDKL
ncbi:hypothetical protein ACLHDG_09350 [Sulfurovum sp. CS9]|uniref:hypothetical protein n=1 Tax=Sulfurovum sp. CS9 TaxID=3391146 RepID=UPI0039EAEEC8